MRRLTIFGFCATSLTCLLLSGCGRSMEKPGEPPPPEVIVCYPVARPITDYNEFTGRTEAVKTVDIRARVSGYLENVLFKEGMEVQEGETLFVIDPRTYKADYDRALANLALAKAHLARVEADFKRAQELLPRKAMAQSDFDLAKGDRDEGAASVEVAEAALKTAKNYLEWTDVVSPISGRISRQMIDPGNLVKADDTVLSTVVSQDPIYAYFDVDERTNLEFKRMLEAGKVQSARDVHVPVWLGLVDENGYPHEGMINFVDNRLDPMTGTLQLRGQFKNSNRLLAPGMFARIRVPVGTPHRAILVPEGALGSDQGQRFLYVVDKKDTIEYRPVTVGALRDGMRVIDQGLSEGERVVLGGLQAIKPKMVVRVKEAKTAAQEPTTAVAEKTGMEEKFVKPQASAKPAAGAQSAHSPASRPSRHSSAIP